MTLRFLPSLVFLTILGGALYLRASDDVVFKSDVALSRVDAQVVDRNGRNITGLRASDFVLQVDGKTVPIRHFASEEMPIDIVLLLDVSGSMQPHVERVSSAAEQALNVLGAKDRIAIAVFNTNTRFILPFKSDHSAVTAALRHLMRSERFNGGTRITDAMVRAADYLGREARPEARRAVVILTDDETQDEEDEPRVEHALAASNAVLSFLQAPYEQPSFGGGRGRHGHGPWGGGGGGGSWPGGSWPGGGGVGFPGGGWPRGGGSGPYGHGIGDRSHSAGTATIAADSGGDTMQVTDASALEDTLTRLRQRYLLNFYLADADASAERTVRVDLSPEAKIRYNDSDIHYRQVFAFGKSGANASPTMVSHASDRGSPDIVPASRQRRASGQESMPDDKRRSVAVSEDSAESPVNTVPANSETAPR